MGKQAKRKLAEGSGKQSAAMRKLLIGLFILIFVLAAAVFIGPSLVNWNDYKGRIAEAVERETGRQLSIDGDISLTLLPSPALSVRGVRLANLPGAENPDMASLRSLDVLVAFAPLLEGRIQVRSLELVEPTIRLEVLPDGRRNWEFAPADTAASQDAASSEGFGGDVRFDRIAISKGTVIYSDRVSGREERIENLDARIAATSLEGPFSLSGSATIHEIGLRFDGGTGRLAPQGSMPLNLVIAFDGADAELRFNGSVDQSTTPLSLTGTLLAKGQDPRDLAASLGMPDALPEAVSGPFQIGGDIAYGGDRLDLANLSVVLADLRAEGFAGVMLGGETPEAELTLRVSQLNLDALLPEAGEDDGAEQAGTPGAALADFTLPDGLDASLDLTVQTMIYKDQVVRESVLRGRLSGGSLQLEEASALLPGGSRVALDGALAPSEGGPRFSGSLQAESDNLRTLLGWLEIGVDGISAERLRRASLITQIVATPRQIDLTAIDAVLDVSKITGGLAIALGQGRSFGAGITIDKINLDAYLGAKTGGGGENGDAGSAANPLAGFDANLDLRAGQVVYQGQTLYDLHLDATVQNGGMTIREARVGNLANSRAALSGRLEGLPDAPALRDGSFDVAVNDPAAVSRVLGLESDGPLVRLGPFTAQGAISGGLQGFTLDGKIDAAPLSGQLAGSFSGLPLEPEIENGRFDLTIKQPAALAAVAGIGDPDGTLARLGPVTLAGTASGGAEALTLDATAGFTGGSLAAKGSAGSLLTAPELDLALDLRQPDLSALVAVFAPDQALPAGSGGIDLKAQVAGSPQRMTVSGIAGRVGPTDLSGEVIYDNSGARPLITADLDAGELPLAAFGLAGAGGEDGAAPAPNSDERWSSQAIDTGPLRRFDADIDLQAETLIHEEWRLEQATVLAKLRDGVLTIERLDGGLFGGSVAVTGTVTAQQDIAADLSVTAEQVDTAKLAGVLGGVDRVSGPLSFSADMTTRGISQRELVDNLNGTGLIDGKLQARASAEEKGLAVLLGFLGSQVKEVQGIADAAFLILNAFGGEAASLSGTLNIENGVIRTDDGRLDGQGAFALLRGMAANLPDWQIDFATQLFQNADTENPFVTLGLIGPLDDPNTKLGGLAMTPSGQQGLQGMIQNLTGQGGQQSGGAQSGLDGLGGVLQNLTGGGAAQQETEGQQQPSGSGQGGLGGVLQGITGGVLGGQAPAVEQQEAPASGVPATEVPAPQAPATETQGSESDATRPLTEVIEGEAGQPSADAPVQQPAQQPAEQPVEQPTGQDAEEAPSEETLDGIVQPTPRPAEVEQQPAAEQAPVETPAVQEPVTQVPQDPQPQAEEPSGEQQLQKLLEGIGVRKPEPEPAPAEQEWQEPQQPQSDGGASSQPEPQPEPQPEATPEQNQPGANFIRNILKGTRKN